MFPARDQTSKNRRIAPSAQLQKLSISDKVMLNKTQSTVEQSQSPVAVVTNSSVTPATIKTENKTSEFTQQQHSTSSPATVASKTEQ